MAKIKCVACLLGRKWECEKYGRCDVELVDLGNGDSSSSGSSDASLDLSVVGQSPAGEVFEGSELPSGPGYKPRVPVREVNTYKDDSALRDQQSTGRKRAAVMYPLDSEASCEWSKQKNCGGGSNPITGCADGKQEARHHGPHKNTLDNEPGNVHRICHKCHNRWHARNDDGYVWSDVYPAHSPMAATIEDILESELQWAGVVLKNVRD